MMRAFKLLCATSAALLLTACPQQGGPKQSAAVQKLIAPDAVFAKMIQQGRRVDEPQGWVNDILATLDELKLQRTNANVCSVMAVIEQESGFKEDPPVAGLNQLLTKKIAKMEENLLMLAALEVRLSQTMSNGLTFRQAIKNIKTERDLVRWYEAFTEAQFTGLILDRLGKGVDDLVSTVGSMQVSIDYSRRLAQTLGKPTANMRDTLYTRVGGVFYGTAHLLYYPARYDNVLYRFADFNAGQYASRNAGFQVMLSQLTGQKIVPDGDLLSHASGTDRSKNSQTQAALIQLFSKSAKNIQAQTIADDLAREKSIEFENTTTYATVIQLMQAKGLKPVPAALPKIFLKSEKITRSLTTEWYANSVNARYQRCMGVAEKNL
ncbi:DUF1615 family protein [Hydromonas duriensis]|uniref:Uncharacterized protein DUF1615 n=1 Tax=Hydromonas duriensis TaxID=1527608 RepID=A0A4R6Y9Q9_9BURK|nr:DUF1615 family protein [Hydromonas duriensis]TDR32204.1 uncharacterized protein DUF1615 [Hydromonas duriensis]